MNQKKSFSDNTYSLAKGLHHINIAKMYFEDLKISTAQEVRYIFIQYIQKCDWIIKNLYDRLNDTSRTELKKELDDSILFEAIYDKLILLDKDQRELVENIMDNLIKGEKIEVVNEK